jgi:membrane protease YdiL (CAAX protease family)
METAFVSLVAYGVFGLTWGLTSTIMLAMYDGANTSSAAQFQAYGAAYIMARRDFAEYLALNWPSSGELLRALAITAILLLAQSLALSFVGAGEAPPDPYASGRPADGFLIFLIGGCIAVPVMEEFVVRGFMFRGWSQSFLGPVGSIVLTSVLWGMMHFQYDWFGRFWIFVAGLALGYFRWRSNSTWLTVMVHSTVNILILFMIGLQL